VKELHRRLRAVVERHRSAREASLASGFESNFLASILRDPNRIPSLETLDRLAQAYDWPICDVVYWALGRESGEQPPPRARLSVALDDLGLSPPRQARILEIVDDLLTAERASGGQ
jgi:hypothetical protein